MKKPDILLLKSLFVFYLILIIIPVSAQIDSAVNYPNLLLPKFTKSVIKLKSGEIRTAVLNYNTVEEEMVFMQQKLFLILDNPQLIDSVFMANRTFVPVERGFLEVLLKAPVTLLKQHKSYVEFEGYPTGYGAKSQTTAPNYVRQIYGLNGAIDLKIPVGFRVRDDSKYWIRMNFGMSSFESKRQFLKIFPDHEKALNTYITKNNTDFKRSDDVIELVRYCNALFN